MTAPNRGSFGVTICAVLASAAIAHILTTRDYPDISRGRCPKGPLPARARAGERRYGDCVSRRGYQASQESRGEGPGAGAAATMGPERFLREIEVAARLQHPHILPLHD